jgi:hypothetical protein
MQLALAPSALRSTQKQLHRALRCCSKEPLAPLTLHLAEQPLYCCACVLLRTLCAGFLAAHYAGKEIQSAHEWKLALTEHKRTEERITHVQVNNAFELVSGHVTNNKCPLLYEIKWM